MSNQRKLTEAGWHWVVSIKLNRCAGDYCVQVLINLSYATAVLVRTKELPSKYCGLLNEVTAVSDKTMCNIGKYCMILIENF